jgi:hypothetical protein
LKGIFDQEVRVVNNARHVATTPAPAMTFEQLMEVAMRTVTTVALISDSMGNLKEAMTKNATSIDRLIELTRVNKESILTLGNRLEDIDRSVSTSIIHLEHAIRANATTIKHLENSSGLPCLSTTVGEIDTKVDTVYHEFDQHVGEVFQELDTFAALKLIIDNVRYSQLSAIRDHIRRVELKSGADYTLVSDGVTRLETMFFEGLDKVNIRVDDILHVHPSPTTAPDNISAASLPSAGHPTAPAGPSTSTNATPIPALEVHGDGPQLSARVGLHNSPNIHNSGSG